MPSQLQAPPVTLDPPGIEVREHLGLLYGSGAVSIAAGISQLGSALLVTLLLVRNLSAPEFGRFATAQSLASILAALTTLGLANTITQRARAAGPLSFGSVRRLALIAVALALGVGAGATAVLGFADRSVLLPFIVLLPLIALSPLGDAALGWARSNFSYRLIAGASMLGSAVVLTLSGVAVVLIPNGVSAAGARAVGITVPITLLVVMAGRGLRRQRGTVPLQRHHVFATGGASLMILALASAFSQYDVATLGFSRGSLTAGQYAPMSRLLDSIQGFFYISSAYVLAMLTSLRGQPRAFARIFAVCTTWTAAGVLPALLTVLLVPGPVFHLLFGSSLENMTTAARLLGAGVIINVLSGFNGLALLAQGLHREARRAALGGLLVTLIACPALASVAGAPGAAGAVALGMLTYNLGCSWPLWHTQRLLPWERGTLVILACATIPALAGAILVSALSIRGWPGPIIIFIVTQACATTAALKRNPLAWKMLVSAIRRRPTAAV